MDRYSFQPDGFTIAGLQTEAGAVTLSYDEGKRLTQYSSGSATETYSYDLLGNRIKHNETNATFDANGAIRESATASYEYDAQGNRTLETSWPTLTRYQYNELDQLTEVERLGEISRYGYDAAGVRIWKEVLGTRTYFYFTEDGLSGEYNEHGNRVRGYLYEPGQTVQTSPLVIEAAEGYFFSHNDHLGTPHRVVSSTGVLSWSADYSAFGGATVTLDTISNPHRLPGQYYDDETGLHYNLMRYYDPATGAYLTQDPVGAFVTGANRYGYAYADPVNLTDPTGEYVWIGPAFAEEMAVQATELAICEALEEFASDCVKDIASEICNQSWRERALGLGLGTVAPHLKWGERLTKLWNIANRAGPLVRQKVVALVERLQRWIGVAPDTIHIPVNKEVKPRKAIGRDGGISQIIIERDQNGTVLSRTHQVTRDGTIVHQHQDHIGKYESVRRFPNEWVEYPSINAR